MKKYVSLTLVLVLLLTLLTACGASSAAPQYAMKNEAAMEEAPMAMDMAAGNSLTTAGTGQSTAVPENRKWIVTVNMAAETEDLESLLEKLARQIAA